MDQKRDAGGGAAAGGGALAGRVALVTGAGSDIGRAVCRELHGAGARVVATDLPVPALEALEAELPGLVADPCDLLDDGAPSRLAAHVPDVLASVAGLPVVARFSEHERGEWERLWQLNLRAPMALTQTLAGAMQERGWGRLVYVASDSARAGAGGEAVYAATKAGLLGFAKSVARELARDGVTANVVCPGPVDTTASRAILDARPRLREGLLRATPAGRLGRPEEVAAAIGYLASPAAGFVTGQVLSVNGGIAMA
ncbi:SDR family oxidoreductase [Conexibacter sp. JD483]|uniref:SDR family NAD(P)-dependent oxidoreductase n=1 Tax=unclassified Conexibacter TaxID=2627773 RepID=UPI0027193528|nr:MULTISPECIES: SDR family oxidoreductase [unclassified Conexibacter]MDO8186822.1 SDR family oxidoreductase [Conexibacter sp. CPCC 205706]MDO8197424.1 SDR family oxidoreductase [Conexibacter sp. CPCC 205762]MDR9371240.1 SDR family oxidoreductase [Conexibacter sp. JD483]